MWVRKGSSMEAQAGRIKSWVGSDVGRVAAVYWRVATFFFTCSIGCCRASNGGRLSVMTFEVIPERVFSNFQTAFGS
jgi:hypothetical protein